MFGLSIFEILFIGVIALLVFGPEKLPDIARSVGRFSGELKKHSDSFRKEFYNSVYPPAEDLRAHMRDLQELRSQPLKKLGKMALADPPQKEHRQKPAHNPPPEEEKHEQTPEPSDTPDSPQPKE